jgi:O-antigen ligase
MSQAPTLEIEAIAREDRSALKSRIASILGTTLFFSLLCLIVLTAIPFGTSQPWWKAAFVCVVFTLAILWLVEGSISQSWFVDSWPLVLPLAALALFSLLQTLPFGNQGGNAAGIGFSPWNAISADPYQTRFFALLILALTLSGVLFSRYASSEKRMRILINVVISVAVASALFGIVRQTSQHSLGFGLQLFAPESGFGQFINRNHFAFLMEMSLGLILGLILAGGVKREQALIYFAALLPLWTGLVLCGSRGGLIAMLAQVVIAALLFSVVVRRGNSTEPDLKVLKVIRWLPVRLMLILVLIAGVVFGTIWLGGDPLAARIDESRNELNSDASESRLGVNRNEIWQTTWRMFIAHPVLGVGMGGYWAAIPAFHDASGTMTPQEAHNDYLELLASGGLVGLTLGVWFAAVVCKRSRENLRSPNRFRRAACFGAIIGIAGVAFHSLVDFGLHTIVNALVLTTLIVIATSRPRWANEPKRLND